MDLAAWTEDSICEQRMATFTARIRSDASRAEALFAETVNIYSLSAKWDPSNPLLERIFFES